MTILNMETVTLLIIISVSLAIGAFCGAFIMHCINYTNEQQMLKELDSKTKLLKSYENKYEDDGYEAY